MRAVLQSQRALRQQQPGRLPLSRSAFKALLRASLVAARLGHGFITTAHMLLGLVAEEQGVAGSALRAAGVVYQHAEAEVVALFGGHAPSSSSRLCPALPSAASVDVLVWCSDVTGRARGVLRMADECAQRDGALATSTAHLLAALLESDDAARDAALLLERFGAEPEQLCCAMRDATQSLPQSDISPAVPAGHLHEEFAAALAHAMGEQGTALAYHA